MMLSADYVVDMGPKAGRLGGEVVFAGTPREMIKTNTLRGRDLFELVKLYRPRSITKWNRAIIECVITILYSKADAVIALSRKSVAQLSGWQDDDTTSF